MRVFLMIEGQEGVTWEQWTALALACEEHGLEGLFRSDHYLGIGGGEGTGGLDAWATLAALAAQTDRIRLGTLVSPATFRHPSVLAKNVVTVDHISEGRVEVGMGAGWYVREHEAYGFAFPEDTVRMQMLEEQLEIVHRTWKEERFDFEGRHYRLQGAVPLPKPVQEPHPPVIVGGSAGPLAARLAAKWADEYNTISASPEECRRRRERVREAWEREGRDPDTLRFSLMTTCVVGSDHAETVERARRMLESSGRPEDPEDFVRSAGPERLVGTVDQVVARLQELEEVGVERVMLQHLDHQDLEMVALIGREIVPAVA